MKEPYREDVASHSDPESCAGCREASREALTGAGAGRVLTREITSNGGADAVLVVGRQDLRVRYRKHSGGPPAVLDPVHAPKPLTREPGDLVVSPHSDGVWGREGKAEAVSLR